MSIRKILAPETLSEAAYHGNIGFEEMCKFYKICTPAQEKKMEDIIKRENWVDYVALIKETLGIKLK